MGQLESKVRRVSHAVWLSALVGVVMAWPAAAEVTVGTAEVVVKQVTGKVGVEKRQIVISDSVHHNETIETALQSATEVEFIDESRLSIGPGSVITLDSFVFDPGTDSGRIGINAVLGVFRFASSKTKKIAYDIRTPLATVGIRGTRFVMEVDEFGRTSVTTEDDGVVILADCAGRSQEIRQCGRTLAVVPLEGGGCAIEEPDAAGATATSGTLALTQVAAMDAMLGAPDMAPCTE